MLFAKAAAGAAAAVASATALAAIGTRPTLAQQLTSAASASARRLLSSQTSTSAGAASAAGSSSSSTSQWTSWLPWNRKLTGTEKFYWGMFVVASGLITYRRWSQRETDEMREERLRKEAELEVQRKDFLRAVLAGHSFLEGDDPFQGLRPRQIEQFVEAHKGEMSVDDPFEGLSPEEIDEYVAKHGLQALPPGFQL